MSHCRFRLSFAAAAEASGSHQSRPVLPSLSNSAAAVRLQGEAEVSLGQLPHDFRSEFTMSTSPGTVRLHRVLKAPAERVYKAFLDPDAMVKWLPPHGFTGKVHQMDARVGGGYRMSFTNFSTGKSHSFGGTYVELIPGERLRYTDRFDDPNLPGEMNVTISLRKVACGTELSIVQEGIPAAIPVEFCYLGWQESLTLLAQVVEPEIPDGV
jgi:uncharacterized protein YndB with AHSA1/START domain